MYQADGYQVESAYYAKWCQELRYKTSCYATPKPAQAHAPCAQAATHEPKQLQREIDRVQARRDRLDCQLHSKRHAVQGPPDLGLDNR